MEITEIGYKFLVIDIREMIQLNNLTKERWLVIKGLQGQVVWGTNEQAIQFRLFIYPSSKRREEAK